MVDANGVPVEKRIEPSMNTDGAVAAESVKPRRRKLRVKVAEQASEAPVEEVKDHPKRKGGVVEFLAVTLVCTALAIGFIFTVISLADIAQRQRLANAFYNQSEPVDHSIPVADQIYAFPLIVIDLYGWDFKSANTDESLVVTALRDAKVLETDQRFDTLWNYFHLTDMYDTRRSDEVYLRWLGLDNPHIAATASEEFADFMQDSETLGIEYSPSLADVALQLDDRDSSTYGIAAVNIYHLFTEIAERKAAVADGYVMSGRILDARNIINRLANWIRAYNVSYESSYENRANEIFILELLMEDTKTVLFNQAAFTELYQYIRGLEWQEDKKGPWWKDTEQILPLPEKQSRYAPFRCQIQYLNLMRATRLELFDEALERAATLRKDTSCMKLPLLKEWAGIGEYQALAADVLSRSCVDRGSDEAEVCDDNSSTSEEEFTALKKRTLAAGASLNMQRNINLKDDLAVVASTVREARWNGTLPNVDDGSNVEPKEPRVGAPLEPTESRQPPSAARKRGVNR
ncbi:hypothetical protein [Rhizobium leguminosarum]|uniref:hypothetical protein n=1 Tax=Rhizobium leguminosarum TaxID=384 RepID=UPI0003F9B444|nr:hypothetical protein [Rhizobium leguminosarum]